VSEVTFSPVTRPTGMQSRKQLKMLVVRNVDRIISCESYASLILLFHTMDTMLSTKLNFII